MTRARWELKPRQRSTSSFQGGLSVFLHQNPSILVVSREYQVFLELRSHKAVVIAGRGIDQVTDGFLGRPLSGPERR